MYPVYINIVVPTLKVLKRLCSLRVLRAAYIEGANRVAFIEGA